MADRIVDESKNAVPEIDETLKKIMLYALQKGQKTLESGEELTPFSALAIKDNLFMEDHAGKTPEDCFKSARHTVQHVRGADGYGFCYDGYLETDEGQHDALIVEGGTPGGEQGYAIGRLYTPAEQEGEQPVFEDEVVYVGAAPNFMEFTLTENDTDADNPSADDSDAEEADASDENHDAAPTDPQEA